MLNKLIRVVVLLYLLLVTLGVSPNATAGPGSPVLSSVEESPVWHSLVLPHKFSPENTNLTFNVDSTWHLVEGKATQVEGQLWRENPEDESSIRGRISFAIAGLDTDNSLRDSKLRSVMGAETYPAVVFNTSRVIANCPKQEASAPKDCKGLLRGSLKIKDVSKELEIPLKLSWKPGCLAVSGATSIQWADYGVEDPSIFIAKLDSTVNISFNCCLTATAIAATSS